MIKVIFIFLFVNLNAIVIAQDLKGRVLDEAENPIIGANIRSLKNPSKTATTGTHGYFNIALKHFPDTLIIKFIGYDEYIYPIKEVESGVLKIYLKRNLNDIDEVFVNTGYHQVAKERSTGSFTHIDNKMLNRSTSSNILERLEGIASGLQFDTRTLSDSDPEAKANIRVRGINTIDSDSSPLIVIDGFPYEGNIEHINPNSIESITILKDAAAASIWGARAGNGVIVITSKNFMQGDKIQVSLNSNYGLSKKGDLLVNPNYLPSETVMKIQKEKFLSGGYQEMDEVYIPAYVELLIKKRDGLIDNDEFDKYERWYLSNDMRRDIMKYMFTHENKLQHFLNINGGSQKHTFGISAGYDNQNYVKKGSSFSRYNLQIKNRIQFSKKLINNIQVDFSKYNLINNSTTSYSSGSVYESLYDMDGMPNSIGGGYRLAYREQAESMGLLPWLQIPVEEVDMVNNTQKELMFRLTTGFNYKITDEIEIISNYNLQLDKKNEDLFYDAESFYVRNLINRYTQPNGNRVIPIGGIRNYGAPITGNTHAFRLQGRLSKSIKEYVHLDMLAGAEVRQNITESGVNLRLYGFDEESWRMASITDYSTRYPLRPSGTGSVSNPQDWPTRFQNRYLSYFGNIGTLFAQKLNLSGSLRWDGSNLLGVKTNQRGTSLYSIGAAYDLKEEIFIKNIFNRVRVRLTYGIAGNVDKTQSQYPTISLSNNAVTGMLQASISQAGNPDLRWEKVKTFNQGIDFQFKGSNLSGTLEFYQKRGSDLLGNTIMDPTSGIPRSVNYKTNYASIITKGIDLQLGYNKDIGILKYNTSLILSTSNNKITNYKIPPLTYAYYYITQNIPMEGQSIDQLYAFKWYGLSNTTGLPIAYTGDNIVENSNEFTSYLREYPKEDLVLVGSKVPTVFGSMMNSFSVKNITLSTIIGFKGNYYYRRTSQLPGEELLDLPVFHNDYFNRWEKPGDEKNTNVPAYTPRVLNGFQNDFYKYSEILVEKGDHLRLIDLSLSYDIPSSVLKKIAAQKLRVYLYAKNLGLIWKKSNYIVDPDFHQLNYASPLKITAGLELVL